MADAVVSGLVKWHKLSSQWCGVRAALGSIVAHVSFWDRQVEELVAGITALLDGDRTAQDVHVGYPASPSVSGENAHTVQAALAEWTGRGADAVNDLQESIRHLQSVRTDADRRLGDAVTAIHAAAQHARERLRGIRAEADTGIGALQSKMDTANGQQQMAEFLATKTRDVRTVIDEAREASATHIAGLGEARARYNSTQG